MMNHFSNYANAYNDPDSEFMDDDVSEDAGTPNQRGRGAKPKNKYILITDRGTPTGHEFKNASPYAAAQKAATRGFEDIILYSPHDGKIKRYCGCMRDIQEDEHTDYTRRHNITKKAQVKAVKIPPSMQPSSGGSSIRRRDVSGYGYGYHNSKNDDDDDEDSYAGDRDY